jgi:hypothetical protein
MNSKALQNQVQLDNNKAEISDTKNKLNFIREDLRNRATI